MFERRSRYFRLTEQMAPDRHGQLRSGKALRSMPAVAERMRHTIDGNDRLDHLGYKYYRRSRNWWHIVDANPSPLSPLAVLGDGAERSMECSIEFAGAKPPWHLLTGIMLQQPGVQAVRKLTSFAELTLVDAGWLSDLNVALLPALTSAVLTQRLSNALETALQAAGLELTGEIGIAAETANRWLLWDLPPALPFRIEHDATVPQLSLFALQPVYNWRFAIDYNDGSIDDSAIRALITSLGFAFNESNAVGRIGKLIAIPANTA